MYKKTHEIIQKSALQGIIAAAAEKNAQNMFFIGHSGKIEISIKRSTALNPRLAVMFPNDPLQHKGSIEHPVVELIYDQFVKHNFTVVKMNYRGVGKSDGKFEGGVKELINATLLIDWLLSNHNGRDLWSCGFSYGAWVAMQMMMRRPEVTRFLVASLPCNKHDFSFLSPCPVGGLVVHGALDSVTPINVVKELIMKPSRQKKNKIETKYIEGADHFFRDKRKDLEQVVENYILRCIKEDDDMDAR